MVTINKFLQELSKTQVQDISEKYLRGWVNLHTDLKLSDLIDFNRWLVAYDGDYKKFVIDYPENTY